MRKMKRLMIILLVFLVSLIITLIIGKLIIAFLFSKEVSLLFSHSKNSSEKVFTYSELPPLPEPVQRYFKHVLKEGQRLISSVRLKHDGQFKTSLKNDWVNITGEQYFTVDKPGFIWKGETVMFSARDMFIADKGNLIVSLFSLYTLVDGKGDKYNQGELLRWLSESMLFPTNFLSRENLHWLPIDSMSAKLVFTYIGMTLEYIVRFNEVGEIVQMETKRYMGDENLEEWICKAADYKEINNVRIPTKVEATWRLKTGDYSYAKFNIHLIEYDKPYKF